MSVPRIRDIESLRELRATARQFSRVKLFYPVLRPFLRRLGVDIVRLDEVFAKVDSLVRETEELAQMPDQFNRLFTDRGWILYEGLNWEVAKKAVAEAKSHGVAAGEAVLLEYFDADAVDSELKSLYAVAAFRPRMPLAELAAEDYRQERYHACIPVVLALLDGLVNEVHQKVHNTRRGLSSAGVNLEAWDSIAGHSLGLARLVKLFQTGRRRTTTEPITVPFRNGIVHGIDLGYANREVAAKTWAALFATKEWAVRAETGQLGEPPVKPKPTLQSSAAELRATLDRWKAAQAKKALNAAWQPRQIVIGTDIPAAGRPEDFEEGSPEAALVGYLASWERNNYGAMAQYLSRRLGPEPRRAAAEVRAAFFGKRLDSFLITSVVDKAPAITEIETQIIFEEDGTLVERSQTFKLLSEDAESWGATRGSPGAEWKVLRWALV
jgi:hypothetical protein